MTNTSKTSAGDVERTRNQVWGRIRATGLWRWKWLLGTRTLQVYRFPESSELYTETIREVVSHGAGKGE
jgi:hypothetical protein